ncbi:MAG: putative sugar O-methyltransferase [Candidatus Staskawiczbacteria bacterium]|nr:putative sugar O-methyltransferase [Candidatus Staskawiczbacteria bacterium]
MSKITRIKRIEQIREKIISLNKFRDGCCDGDIFSPSKFWKNINKFLSYIRTLPANELEKIRCHIGMGFFIGNPWNKDFYSGHSVLTDREALEIPIIQKYEKYISILPEKLWCSEPETNEVVSQIGIRYKGRLVNSDIVKEQACIHNLYSLGLLNDDKKKKYILEIGPGYGQLIYQLSKIMDNKTTFICVDYPETLFWSAIFLCVNNDEDGIYIPSGDDNDINLVKLSEEYKFILIPNFKIKNLIKNMSFDLSINQNSFQEMSKDQLHFYCRFLAEFTEGWLYSYNACKQFMNSELDNYVHTILQKYFIGIPDDDDYKNFGFNFSNVEDKRIFLGYSKELKIRPFRDLSKSGKVWLCDRMLYDRMMEVRFKDQI